MKALSATLLLYAGFVSTVCGQESADFDQAFQEYKTAIQEFEALRTEFQKADPTRREEINAQLADQYTNMKTKVNDMIDAAIEAYKGGDKSDGVTDLLKSVVMHDMVGVGPLSQAGDEYENFMQAQYARGGAATSDAGGDNYERALEVLSTLIEGGEAAEDPKLAVWGMLAAYNTNQYDQAVEYGKIAEESGGFKETPETGGERELFMQALQASKMIDPYREWWAEEQEIRKAEAEADDLPRVKLTTSKGEIVVELFENQAPIAVANFITLVKDGFYDGVVFHRVLPRFMAQGGDPKGTGTGGPGYCIACETDREDYRRHFRGTLSMAHAGKDTGGSQFFMTFIPTTGLDGRHTAFGRVIEGMEVLSEIQRIDPERPTGVEPDRIVKAEVLRDRGHDYDFEKLPER